MSGNWYRDDGQFTYACMHHRIYGVHRYWLNMVVISMEVEINPLKSRFTFRKYSNFGMRSSRQGIVEETLIGFVAVYILMV